MLQPSQDKSKVLYDAVSKDYDIGTYEEFSAKLQNPEKRKSFYEGVGQEYALGTYEDFESKITPLKKKDNSDVTATTQKSVSETSTGSLDGVGSNGFPAIDKNLGVPGLKPDLKTVDQLANPPKSKVTIQEKTTNKEDVKGFGEGLLNRLDTGIATFSKSFYDAPKMILDAVYAPQNYLSEKLNIPSLKVDPETYAFENIPSKNMDEIVNSNNKKIENYKKEIGGDVVSTFDKGDYVNTFKHAALNSMESAPLIAAAMATGGESLLANSIMIGSSASTQYDQLTKEHPEMETRTKLANAAVNGALEVAVGKFMEGVGGNVWKNVLANKGVKETAQIATNSFKKTLEKVVGDSPMVGVAGEYAEERITDGLQQLNDIATGASSDFNWDQNKNAGLSSLGFGLPNATALYSAKAYISNKTRKRVTETSKQIVKLQNDLQNPELSPENKKIISENISKIYDENKKILGDELEKLKIIPEKTKGELLSIDKNIDKIKDNAIDIKYDVNISEENKTLLLKKLEQDFKDNINRKNEILSKTSEVEFLPLKEQDKLKRQALKELTAELNPDGTKNIEIDNAQITERANKIYLKENEKPQEVAVTETKPQAEVPQQAEAEKVNTEPKNTTTEPTTVVSDNKEVSPTEDVVAPSVVEGETKKINGKELTFYKLEGDNTDSGFAVEKNKDGYVIQSALLPFSKQKQGIGTDFYVRINNESIEKTGSPLKSSENLSNSGGKPFWEKLVDKGLAEKTEDGFKFKEQTKVANEATPTSNIAPDGNVRPRISNVAESGITEQQSTAKENLPSTVDGGEVKGDVEVDLNLDDVSNFLNEQFGAKKLVEVKETPKPKKEVTPKQDKVEQAKGFVTMAVGNLTTSLKDFQGRAKEFSEDTYNRIVNEAKEGALNISAIPPIQIWKSPDTGKFVILAGHSRTKAFSDLASGEIEFSDKYKKTDFEKVNTQIVEAKTLEEAQKIAQESNQGSVQTVVDNAKYVRESLLSTFKNFNQAKTKLKSLYGPAWARIYSYANLNPKGKAMQMLKQFQDANESDSNDKSKKIAEWTGRARADFDKLTDAHENEIFDYLSKNDKIKTYSELGELLNRRVNGLEEFNSNEPLNFEQKVGRGSNEVEIVKEIQDLKNRDVQIKKKIKELQSFGKNVNDTQRKQIKDLTAESIKINTVDIPNAQKEQKQARVADAEQFDIFSQINEQIENGNITPEQVDEFVNDDRKAEEIDPIVEAIEVKAKSENKVELEEVVADVDAVIDNELEDINVFNKGIVLKTKEGNNVDVTSFRRIKGKIIGVSGRVRESSILGKETLNPKEFNQEEISKLENYVPLIDEGNINKNELKQDLTEDYKQQRKDKANSDESILNSDKDLLGDEKEEAMIPLTYEQNPDFNVDDVVYIKSDRDIDKFGKRNQYSVRGKDENGKYVLWGKSNGANLSVDFSEIEKGVNQKRYPLTGSLDAIDYAMGEKLYSEWVKEGRMSASDAKIIIESAGFNVPSDIQKLTRKDKVNAEVDKIADKIKEILPGIKDPDLKKQGISQDDLIDLVASTVKTLVSKGIDINDAIRQVISSIKERFNVDVDEKLVKEKLGVEKPKSKNKNPLREKSSEEISDELGISEKEYLDLKSFVANEPSSGVFNEYLSAETIADVFGDSPTNDQQYEQMVLLNAVQHGNSVLEKARSIFGENYMSKTLEFLQNVKLGNFEKAMVYAALENEIDTLVKSNPSNKVFLATQRLIYADSQANLRNSSKGLNAGRLRRIHNAIKNGYDIDKLTIGLIKPEQQEAKQILKEAIPTGDNLNKASEQEENTEIEKPRVYTQEEFEAELKKAVQASVGKSRNELSKKGKDIADKIRRLKLNKDIAKSDLSLGAYDLAIEAIAQLVEKGSTVAQAIKNVLSDVKYKDIDADKLRQDILGVVNTPRIKDVVKQALIDAGFSREITVTKNAKDENGNDIIENGKKVKVKEKKEVLDWNKLTGRMNSVEALRANVEAKLKEQGYTNPQIEEISNELEAEYKRLTEYIADKALTELERRNQIPKPVNRKSDLDRLVDYHNKGLFGESAKGYERLINKIVGITKREQDVLDKIEAEIEKIKNLREVKIDGSFPDAQSIESQASYIAKSIRNIIAWANLVNARIDKQAIEVLSDIAGISRAAVLGNLYNALQNIYSNNRAGYLARKKFELKGYWTPELNDAFNELKRAVTSDVLINRGLDFGDVVSPFSHHSIFIEKLKDYIEKKYPEGRKRRMIIGALNTFEGRLFLNVMDSRFKSKIVNIDFVMDLVDVLTSERAGKSKMTKEEAVNFVSESLTGVNLEKAKVLAKKFINDVNAMKENTLLENEDNIKRLAFDIVRENLTSGNNFTMDEINDIYQASMKSGGANIGHESNNIISESLKNLNNWIEKKVEDAMKEKDYDKATKYATYAFISKNITYPYMSGGFNWVVLEAEAGTPLGLATGAYKSYKNKNIDLLTDVGKKRMKEDLINKRDAESKLFRGIWGTSIAISAYLAYYGLQAVSGIGDDDEENKRISNKYLREHPEQRKIFDKFSPEVYAVSLAVSDERLSKYLLNKMGYKTDQNDNILTLLKSLQNKNSSTLGALGVLLGQIVSTPGAWRILRDLKRLFRELQGEPMAQTEQRVTSFLNGYFKGALVDYLGLRPGTNYDLEKVKKEIQNKKTDFTNYTNGIANDINSGKITKEDAAKLVKKKYEDNDELLDKAKEIIQNSVNDKEIREGLKDADIWYMEMHNEKDIRAKAYIYYQNELKNNASKTDKNFDKYMNIALYGIDEDYYKKFIDLAIEYKDVEEQKSKKKPVN